VHNAHPLEDASAYPRVYRASGGWLIALILCGVVLGIGGFAGARFLASEPFPNPNSRLWIVGICVGFGIFGFYCLLSTLRSSIVLFPDRIEINELTRTSVLSREEIRGWRSLPTSPPGFVFIPREAGRRPVKVAQTFRLDPEFADWLYTLPCLDREDSRRSKAEIRNNPLIGATPGERMKALARGKRLARIVTAVASVALLWGFVYPNPYRLVIVILAALPWAAMEIVRRSRGLLRVDANRNDAHPNVAIAVCFPGLVLLLRSMFDFNIIQSQVAAWISVFVGSLFCSAIFFVDPTLRTKAITVLTMLALSLAYGYGVAIEANTLLDQSSGVNYTASVEGKHIVRGKTTTFELDLAPWGPRANSNNLRIARETYDAVQRGDVVYLTLHRGAFGIQWYYMRAAERR
jgi:hypothetical protein